LGPFSLIHAGTRSFQKKCNLPIIEAHAFSAMKFRFSIAVLLLLLAGCDIPGLGPDPRIAQRDADGKAIGAACRHALRGIEDCYVLNEKAAKTSIFEGWKEMDQYMRENKMEGVPSKETREAKVLEPDEVIIEEKKPKTPIKDKAASETKSKADVAIASSRPIEKAATKSNAE
jgi:hypothetical protein